MRDDRGRQDQRSGGMLALIFAAFFLLFAIIVWGPWNSPHVESNPGPVVPRDLPLPMSHHRRPPVRPKQQPGRRAERCIGTVTIRHMFSPRVLGETCGP